MARRSVTDIFKRPTFSLSRRQNHPESHANASSNDKPSAAPSQSSPHSRASLPLSNHSSVELPEPDVVQLNDSLVHSIKESSRQEALEQSFQSTEAATENSTLGDSLNRSYRVVKHGKEMVISSDGEDTESVVSLEDPEQLFKESTGTNGTAENNEQGNDGSGTERALRSRGEKNRTDISVPKYKFTLDSLVTNAVNDREVEAGVAELKSALAEATSSNDRESALEAATTSVSGQRRELQKHILTSALDGDDDGVEIQRLYDAVQRTEAFDYEKTWAFFDTSTAPSSPPEFPLASISPGTFMAVLREHTSRERALHSGIVEFAFSRNFLPDELITWVFHSVPCEPRDDLRQTYCRVFKHAPAGRIQYLIRPKDIDDLFRRLGARPNALSLSETIVPETPSKHGSPKNGYKQHAVLLSVLDLFRSSTDLFSDDTREHILKLLFRLEIDTSLMGDGVVCSGLERTITAVLESIPKDSVDSMVRRFSAWLFDTVKNTVFQSRILKHILPVSDWIALFRCRLAVAFLVRDPTPLTEAPESVLDLKRITDILKDKRFDVKAYKGRSDVEYDYDELGAVTTLLNIVINSGSEKYTSTAEGNRAGFNKNVDRLADRIKKIFTSIEDSGASHLKRTQAKEGLEALHYRIVYSVRSNPPPTKNLFRSYGKDAWQGATRSSSFMEKYLTASSSRLGGGEKVSIQEHHDAS